MGVGGWVEKEGEHGERNCRGSERGGWRGGEAAHHFWRHLQRGHQGRVVGHAQVAPEPYYHTPRRWRGELAVMLAQQSTVRHAACWCSL